MDSNKSDAPEKPEPNKDERTPRKAPRGLADEMVAVTPLEGARLMGLTHDTLKQIRKHL